MSTYREIHGKAVKSLSTDPSATTDAGQIWYNTASGTFKSIVSGSAWSSGSNMVTGRSGLGSFGTQTAAVGAGGYVPPNTNVTEEYNGSGWTTAGNITTTRQAMIAGAGPQTAGMIAAGYTGTANTNATEEFNGSSWTNGGDLTRSATRYATISGTETAGLCFGGFTPPGTNATEEYNGSAWTGGNAMNVSSHNRAGAGTQSASFAAGKEPTGGESETYDGTSWTAITSMNTARQAGEGSGNSTAGLVFGGNSPAGVPVVGVNTESWDGSSWTAQANLSAGIRNHGTASQGTSTSALGFGGYSTANTTATEEYNVGATVITGAAWASGNNINTARTLGGSAIPTVSDGIIFGGGSPYKDATEKYDGTTWTTVPGTLNTARGYNSGFGTSTAAVSAGGYTAPNNPQSLVEEYNGSSWSEVTNLPGSRKSAGNCGTLTAGLIMGGATAQPYGANVVNTAFEYDGTSWTATPGNLPEAKGQGMSGGTQTAAYYAAGRTPSWTQKTAEYNGSSFSEGGDVISLGGPPSGAQGATGTQTAGLATGGQPAKTNTYDGTTWVTGANFNTGRNKGMGGGTATAALIAGGGAPGGVSALTEEFTAATTGVNVKTLTQS